MSNKDYMNKIAEDGQLIIISGASGVGKRTVVNEYVAKHDDAFRPVSVTTREMHEGDENGKNHWFVSSTEFDRLVRTNQLFEYTYYNRNGYGTPRVAVDDALKKGKNVILIEDVVGAMQIKGANPEATLVFLLTPTWDELEQRIRARHEGKTEDEIQEYIVSAQEQILCANQYDYILVNDTVDETVRRLDQIIQGNRYRLRSMNGFLEAYKQSEILSKMEGEINDFSEMFKA